MINGLMKGFRFSLLINLMLTASSIYTMEEACLASEHEQLITQHYAQRNQKFTDIKTYCDKYSDRPYKLETCGYDKLGELFKELLDLDDAVIQCAATDHNNYMKLRCLVSITMRNTQLLYYEAKKEIEARKDNKNKDVMDNLEVRMAFFRRISKKNIEEFKKLDSPNRSEWFSEKFLTEGSTIISLVPSDQITLSHID